MNLGGLMALAVFIAAMILCMLVLGLMYLLRVLEALQKMSGIDYGKKAVDSDKEFVKVWIMSLVASGFLAMLALLIK